MNEFTNLYRKMNLEWLRQLVKLVIKEIYMSEINVYKLVENILNDMDKEELYDGYTLSIFKERFEREFNYYLVELCDRFIDEFNNRKEEEKRCM